MKKYTFVDIAKRKIPRLIISMRIYDGTFECGFNEHYAVDDPVVDCLIDFFQTMKRDHPDYWVDINRSKLEFEYVDMPSNNVPNHRQTTVDGEQPVGKV